MSISITKLEFPTSCFIDEYFEKYMIFIHHTTSDGNPFGVKAWWQKQNNKVSTPFLIARGTTTEYKDGEVFQLFPSTRGCWHLGLTKAHLEVGGPNHKSNSFLNWNSIGIEICNWGGLIEKDGKYLTYTGDSIPESQLQHYPDGFRGYKFFEKYTPAQLDSLCELLKTLCVNYSIDPKFKGMEMFDVNKNALCGENGIWTHCSVRPPQDKQDCHPQPELIQMLQSL